jgi:hypothetical protein
VAANLINDAIAEIDSVVEELREEQPEEYEDDDFRGGSSSRADDHNDRSVFDDVDQ